MAKSTIANVLQYILVNANQVGKNEIEIIFKVIVSILKKSLKKCVKIIKATQNVLQSESFKLRREKKKKFEPDLEEKFFFISVKFRFFYILL